MPLFKVRVKWGKQKYEDVELNTDEPPMVFKMQLFSLSGVPPERQKVMVAGGTLQDDAWGKAGAKIKQNMMLMMMGSAEDLPEAPKEKPKFIEDMSEVEAAYALALPSGLENFGNTCYMNATLQCLKVVPELRACLQGYQPPQAGSAVMGTTAHSLTGGLKVLYDMMDLNQARIPLLMFLKSLHTAVPQFSEKDEKTGVYRQQDAHECWSSLVSHLAQTLTVPRQGPDTAAVHMNFMEQYFGVHLQTTYKCLESPEEMETSETEKSYQISCFIAQEVKYMHTAIQKGLEGGVEKLSPSLGRNAQYSKNSRISRLPAYLAVQFVRFFVGKAGDSDEIVSKKILKDVKFTMKLDVYDFCSPSLQEKLLPARTRFKEVEDKKAALKAKMIAEGKLLGPKHKQKVEEEVVEYEPFDFPDDVGSNNSGLYDLVAVLTHQGRSSSSGHYLGWVRHKGADWLKLDDDKVSMVTEEGILKLSGGGDWHVAYILLYAPRRPERLKEEPATDSEQTS